MKAKQDKWEKQIKAWLMKNGFYDACEDADLDEVKSLARLLRRIHKAAYKEGFRDGRKWGTELGFNSSQLAEMMKEKW